METLVMDQGMLVSGIILAASFILIFTETLHGFHRVKVAMTGAAVMLVVGQSYGFYSPEQAFEAVDWNVVFLLKMQSVNETSKFKLKNTRRERHKQNKTSLSMGSCKISSRNSYFSLRHDAKV